jgi:hypothetical protein
MQLSVRDSLEDSCQLPVWIPPSNFEIDVAVNGDSVLIGASDVPPIGKSTPTGVAY